MAEQRAETQAKQSGIGETIKVIVQALLIALVFRTFLFHPFNIPSGSMMPTLLVGDYLFVSKFAYGYSKFSFPFVQPPFEGRIWEGIPERGDIAVFRPPREPNVDYIKRVIGLPGDRIQMRDGALYLNGEAVTRERLDDYQGEGAFGAPTTIRQYRETLPNGVSYMTLDMRESPGDNTNVYEVPPGHYFMMGDNRDNSQDSRFLSEVGFVPAANLVGRAEIIFFSVDTGEAPAWHVWSWPWTLRGDRFFDLL